MPMTLRLDDEGTAALRLRAEHEARSMQDIVRAAVREYIEAHSREDLIDAILDTELPRFAEALDRLSR